MSFLLAPIHDTTWSAWFVAIVVMYYFVLWVISLTAHTRRPHNDFSALFALIVPARNEELVIGETIKSLRALDDPNHLIFVMNDNSSDRTSEIAHQIAAGDPRIIVVDRDPAIAGTGKSDVLNHAYELIGTMLRDGDPRFAGRTADDVLIGIVDADGRLDHDTLRTVAPYFADPKTGQLQIGVKIQNAQANLLARMQDMEFVGFSSLVQVARDSIGSSGLGGNGQFTRLAALDGLGRAPWTPTSLTEDLDLGLALVARGWVTRFTSDVFVHQQGLTQWRPLLRQRTRWIQGHYQCWRHIPALLFSREARWVARADLIAYLLLVVTVVVVSFDLLVGLLGSAHVIDTTNNFLGFIPDGLVHRVVSGFFMLAPIVAFTYTYQRHSDYPLRWWEVPGFSFLFTLYSYVWFGVTLRAWARMVLRRNNWTKTPRVAVAEAVVS